ncbi:MAG TPA: chemotaxis protein CheA [Syntrophorhabdaceae bacterium]|nr:chemotaxis protein CheA [Syntrophorhabdaceae bacterium]
MGNNTEDKGLFIISEYLDDYFAECEEHITAVKRHVVSLDPSKKTEKKIIDELLRSFHTIKGLSGMVGFEEAEMLSHSMEDYFKAIRDEKITLSRDAIDNIIEGVKKLEFILAERKEGRPASDIKAFNERLKNLIEDKKIETEKEKKPVEQDTAQLNEDVLSKIKEEIKKKRQIWQFYFSPSNELVNRGINVGVIRTRLSELGEIIYAAPRILEDGGVVFEFIVATDSDESAFLSWRDDGLKWKRYEIAEKIKREKENGGAGEIADSDKFPRISTTNTVRVDLKRLDELMEMVGELVITKARLDDILRGISRYIPEQELDFFEETHMRMGRQLKNLREGIMRIRMVPIGEVFDRMRFVVLDLEREMGKKIHLEIIGENTEIDKLVVERMMDPMLHLVRNAISHGIEKEEERISKGKSKQGNIKLSAHTSGDSVVIEIEDDGRGIDAERIISKAKSKGLINEDFTLSFQERNREILNIICSTGFSTRENADMASGRGLGMTIVKNAIETLGGSLSLETEKDKGTRFIINLPLTLEIVDAFILIAGGQLFAIPQPSVKEVIEIEPEKITIMENNELILYRGEPLPVIRLSRLFNLKENYGQIIYGIIIGRGYNSVAVMVEQVITKREIVIRPITDTLVSVKGIGGATELGDGKPILILNASELLDMAMKR